MGFTVDDLVGILDLETLEPSLFRGRSPDVGWQRIFGGLVVAQAVVAATRTVADRPIHSLHGYFLRPGNPRAPLVYEVSRLRDGGSFSTRQCTVRQHGEPIFCLSASFHRAEPGFEHAATMPDVPSPDSLPDEAEMLRRIAPRLPAAVRVALERERPLELRPVDTERFDRAGTDGPHPRQQAVWIRTRSRLPNDTQLHAAVLAYLSDMTLLDTVLIAHGRSVFDPDLQVASLDHAVWFHEACRPDEWLLYAEDTPSASAARGLARGQIFSRDGRLVASVAQEGLVRARRHLDEPGSATPPPRSVPIF